MENIKSIISFVQKTNPEMTEEKLIEKLGKSRYSAMAIMMTAKNYKSKER